MSRDTALFLFVVGYVIAVIGVSIVYRIRQKKFIFRPKFANALFNENWRSGRSLRSFITRIGGANNCLWVTIANETLFVGPHFPFDLMFLPEIYGLDYQVPAAQIVAVERREVWYRKGRVRITFLDAENQEQAFFLWLKYPQDFVQCLQSLNPKIFVAED